MAFGLKRAELVAWKDRVSKGEIAFLTHYWEDKRFPGCYTVTKVGCADTVKLIKWGEKYGLKPEWVDHHKKYPHYDLFGHHQINILTSEGLDDHIKRFNLKG